ncbi:triosephosphate isomerase [Buchnera aphidicola (Nipponaphis monzeni)]|uniref:Triosephosphate isomerase n=1 Tax=Buchnera aphidicola (Nipponaphis monzeni) TaxID=2495405 RepID=A0A455TAD3_9GAMM|nr:triose-phosphate isomerase [Buchnera aphidicola]BBI01250.1 triosephosphate isomerase [Buchnera aphidicola (Nipponaphis monzeni)]
MKKLLIIGNWKLNNNKKIILDFCKKLNSYLSTINYDHHLKISIAPPILHLETFNLILQQLHNNHISLTAQNIDVNILGSFTGETSISMLQEIENIKYVIVGHSERRIHHNETKELIAKKFKLVKSFKLIPILCIGETKEEKNANKAQKICKEQIDTIIQLVGYQAFDKAIIAYEPIWAIGSNQSASTNYIQYMHQFIRHYISRYDINISKKLIIQYGGSVNKKNALEILSVKDVNGVLIGNSSLDCDQFIDIIKCTKLIKY